MARLNLHEVEHIAELAKLGLTQEEMETFRDQLSAILDYAERLQALDTTGIPPTFSALPLANVMRPDKIIPALETKETLANAPEAEANSFVVKAILD